MRQQEQGQAVIVLAIGLAAIIAAIGLAINSAQLFAARRGLQDAADAGALAGAVVLYEGGNGGQLNSAVRADVARNKVPAGTVTVTSIRNPPVSGPHAGDPEFVAVDVAATVVGIFPGGGGTVTAHSIAGPLIWRGIPAMTVTSGGGTAVSVKGNGNLIVTGGDLLIRSIAGNAAETTGNGIVSARGHDIKVAGGVSGTGYSPAPQTGVPQATMPDPLAALPPPPAAGLPIQSCCGTIVRPGIYPSGLHITANAPTTLQPGVYIIEGGLDIQDNATVTGDGVFLFITGAGYPSYTDPSGSVNCGTVRLHDRGTITLTAATTGVYAGVLLYVDQSCAPTAFSLQAKDTLTDPGALVLRGTIYAPTSDVNVNGNTDLTLNTALIANSISVVGAGSLSVTYNVLENARPPSPPTISSE